MAILVLLYIYLVFKKVVRFLLSERMSRRNVVPMSKSKQLTTNDYLPNDYPHFPLSFCSFGLKSCLFSDVQYKVVYRRQLETSL